MSYALQNQGRSPELSQLPSELKVIVLSGWVRQALASVRLASLPSLESLDKRWPSAEVGLSTARRGVLLQVFCSCLVALGFALCGPLVGELAYMYYSADKRDELACYGDTGVPIRVGAQLSVVRSLTDAVSQLLEGEDSRCSVGQAYEFLTTMWKNVRVFFEPLARSFMSR